MLKANLENGNSLLSFQLTEKPNEKLFCPGCGSEVIFKNGAIKVPHFAHKPNSDCSFGTGESESHMLMKKNFYEITKRKYPALIQTVEDNSFNKRRADLSIVGKDKKLVVEFQASKISTREIIKRTLDYNRQGYYVLWIFHISRLKAERFFEKGRKRMPEEILRMGKYGLLNVMTDGSEIRKVKLVGSLETKTMRKCVWEDPSSHKFIFGEVITEEGIKLKFATLDHHPTEYPNYEKFREENRLRREQQRKSEQWMFM